MAIMGGDILAKGDALDRVLAQRLHEDEWKQLAEILDIKYAKDLALSEKRKKFNGEIRHFYGHSVPNLGRNEFEPDYWEIILGVGDKLKIDIGAKFPHWRIKGKWNAQLIDSEIENLEDLIMGQVLEICKAEIIKKKGPAEWGKIEKEVEIEFNRLLEEGKISATVANHFSGATGAALAAAIIAGRLSGFASYMLLSRAFFAISRTLGWGIGVALAGPILGRAMATFFGPAGWAISGALLVYDLGNTNWKKVIPAIVMIAAFRKRLLYA